MQSASSNSPTAVGSASIVSALHRHALESILGFFSLKDLHELMPVCTAFRRAIASMAPLQQEVDLWFEPDLVAICSSPLLVHVGGFWLREVGAQSLALLATKAANLRSLRFELADAGDAVASWMLPPKLTDLELSAGTASAERIHRVLSAAAALSSLGKLELSLRLLNGISFVSLGRLESLHTLFITVHSDYFADRPSTLEPDQIDALRSMTRSLTELDFRPGLTTESTCALFAPGHRFRLLELGRTLSLLDFTSEVGDRIACLPLETLSMRPTSSINFLPRMAPSLRDLQLQLRDCADGPDATVAALSCLTCLTCLAMSDSALTATHLTAILSSLPQLQQCFLNLFDELQSLSFIAVTNAPKLQAFSLANCSHPLFSSSELRHLRSQPMLTELSLVDSFNAPLDEATRSQFDLPSLMLPLLTTFQYRFDEQQ